MNSFLAVLLPIGILVLSAFSSWGREYFQYREAISVITENTDSISQKENPSSRTNEDRNQYLSAELSETILLWPNKEIKTRLLKILSSAKTQVDFSVYLLSDPDVVTALIDASWRGVKIRGILERDPFRMPGANRKVRDRLLASGAKIVSSKDDAFAYTHAKYLIADNSEYVFSTGNYAKTSFWKNREFFVFGNDPETTKFLSKVFLADFSGLPFSGPIPDRMYIAPSNAREKLEKLIVGASKTIRIFAPSLSDERLIRLLSEKADSWTDVAVCLESFPSEKSETGGSAEERISRNLRFTRSHGPMLHAKTLLVDRASLYLGSANFTENSLDRNREIGAIFVSSGTIRAYENTLETDCKW